MWRGWICNLQFYRPMHMAVRGDREEGRRRGRGGDNFNSDAALITTLYPTGDSSARPPAACVQLSHRDSLIRRIAALKSVPVRHSTAPASPKVIPGN